MGVVSPVIGCLSFGIKTGPEVYSWRSLDVSIESGIELVWFGDGLTAAADSHEGWFHLEEYQSDLFY